MENGNFIMGNKGLIQGDIVCRNGTVEIGADNIVKGDVYAAELKRGRNSDIQGKFIKQEKKRPCPLCQ